LLQFAGRRLAQAVLTLWGVSVIVFVIFKSLPGDRARILCNPKAHECGPAALASVRHQMGLDRPYWRQYLDYVNGWLHIDVPALQGLWPLFANTLYLVLGAVVIQCVAGVAMGLFAAVRRRSPADALVSGLSVVFVSLPVFVVATALLVVFTYPWGWFGGFDFSDVFVRASVDPPPFPQPLAPGYWFPHLLLPTLAIALGGMATIAMVTRASLLETLGADYLQTARAKGLHPRAVVGKHALKLALLPVVTIAGVDLGRIIAGDVVVETIWHWPGIGGALIPAIGARNGELVLSITLVFCAAFVVVNALIDIAYALIDPRIRAG
jgi:ABC-type dipeptide/oligopeptide/nickel transport system permease component